MTQRSCRPWTVLLIAFALTVAWSMWIGTAEAQQGAPQAAGAQGLPDSSSPSTHRLYDDLGFFFDNSAGKDFTITLEVRDINHISRGPSEMLVKVYNPEGKLAVREVIPDDGINPNVPGGTPGAWDHEGFYYATEYDRGLQPLVPWSQWSEPARLAAMAKRTFTYKIKGEQKGVYRLILAGGANLFATVSTDPGLPYGVNGGPDWMAGHHDIFKKRFFFIPRGTQAIEIGILELDLPASRSVTVKTLAGKVLASANATRGMAESKYVCNVPNELDDNIVTVEVSSGAHDYMLRVEALLPKEQRNWRGQPRSLAVLCPTEAAAKSIQNGAIYHDGQVFWQGYQVRMYDWLKKLKPEALKMPEGLPHRDGFISVGSHQSPMQFLSAKRGADLKDPKPGTADIVMHHYAAHKNPIALNVAISEMLEGMRIVGPNDHVMHGRNLAYEQGTYSYFYHRPAWRILQQSDASPDAKEIIKEFVISIGDRLAFGRGIELVNGNSAASLVQGLRYCVEASQDPLQKELFETYWQRFSTGGFGERAGIGPSGGIQEGYGYDYHYGGYVMRGWQAGIADLKEERFRKALNNLKNLYSYVYCDPNMAAPWNSRTAAKLAGGVYGPGDPQYPWKGAGGPDITGSVLDANEFFYARRANYYLVAYAGRITPSWLGESFHGQIGFSGGLLAQVVVPGKGQVINSKVTSDYGGGMHPSSWRNFHLHGLVGTAADGSFIVTSYSEPERPRLDGNTLRVDGIARQSCVHYFRTYSFGANDITATVRLAESDAEKVFGIYGGPHGLRGYVNEAYEMIPYCVVKVSPGKRKPPEPVTKLTRLGVDGKALGPVTKEAGPAAAVLIEQPDYGVRIELDRTRPVLLGNNDTLLVQLVAPAKGGARAEGEGEASKDAAEAEADEKDAGEAEHAESGEDAAPAVKGRGVPASSVSLAYRIVPYAGQAPAGPVAPIDAVAAAAAASGVANAQPGGATPMHAPPKPAVIEDRPIKLLKAIDSLDNVAAALAKVEPMSIKLGEKQTLADLRFAIAGEFLAVDGIVYDPSPRRESVVWRGSCIEVYGAMPDNTKISQLWLAPAVEGTPAGGFVKGAGKEINPASDIKIRTSAIAGKGYSVQALIPLALLGLDAKKERITLEFQAGTATGAPGKDKKPMMVYAPLFGSLHAYEDASRYGRFVPKAE